MNNWFRLWSTGRRRLSGWRKTSSWCFTRFLRSPKQRGLTASMGTLSKSEINPFYTNTPMSISFGHFPVSFRAYGKIERIFEKMVSFEAKKLYQKMAN